MSKVFLVKRHAPWGHKKKILGVFSSYNKVVEFVKSITEWNLLTYSSSSQEKWTGCRSANHKQLDEIILLPCSELNRIANLGGHPSIRTEKNYIGTHVVDSANIFYATKVDFNPPKKETYLAKGISL